MSKIQRASYHQAGYAVSAFVLRRRFGTIMIPPDSGDLGNLFKSYLSHHDNLGHDPRSRNKTEDEIVIHFAGEIAEKLYTSGYNWEVARGEDSTVVYLVQFLVSSLEERDAYLDRLFIRAKELIKYPQHWRAVECLADELLKQRTLSHREAKRIISEAMRKY